MLRIDGAQRKHSVMVAAAIVIITVIIIFITTPGCLHRTVCARPGAP